MAVRVGLDLNLWSYIARQGEADSLVEVERQQNLRIVVPPSILLEALQTSDDELRAQIIRVLTTPVRDHPVPEAAHQGREVVGQIRRLRPRWLRRRPQTDSIPSLEKFWTRKIWQVARDDPTLMHNVGEANEAAATAKATLLDEQDRNADELQRFNAEVNKSERFRPEAVDTMKVTFFDDAPRAVTLGWDGDPIDAWRFDVASDYWNALVTIHRRARRTGEDSTLGDWTAPWLRIDDIARDRESWNRLWYYEAEVQAMPYNWIYWAVWTAQLGGRSGSKAPGNPQDAQHATYLAGIDLFLTADKRFARVLQEVESRAPVPMARSVRLDASRSITAQVAEVAGKYRSK